MELKKIKEDIERLVNLTAGWSEEEQASVLERDLALEILRDLYARLRFEEQESVPKAETIAEMGAESITRADKGEGSVDEIADMATEEQITAPQPEHLDPQKPVIPRMVDADVIRTLYGSDDITPKTTDSSKTTDSPEIIEPVQAPAETEHTQPPLATHLPAEENAAGNAGENAEENTAENTETTVKTTGEAHGATLGDVMTGRLTLGETLRNGNQDTASKIAATDTSSLRESIGLNDRFVMIRDMFDGEASAYNEAITALEGFTDMDEAIIYIHDTYNWNADSEGVKLLVNLLERKLN